VKLDRDGLHDLNMQVDWQRKGGTYWVSGPHRRSVKVSLLLIIMWTAHDLRGLVRPLLPSVPS
jgi:hypothetical protein